MTLHDVSFEKMDGTLIVQFLPKLLFIPDIMSPCQFVRALCERPIVIVQCELGIIAKPVDANCITQVNCE